MHSVGEFLTVSVSPLIGRDPAVVRGAFAGCDPFRELSSSPNQQALLATRRAGGHDPLPRRCLTMHSELMCLLSVTLPHGH
jgi:hypothetical protein